MNPSITLNVSRPKKVDEDVLTREIFPSSTSFDSAFQHVYNVHNFTHIYLNHGLLYIRILYECKYLIFFYKLSSFHFCGLSQFHHDSFGQAYLHDCFCFPFMALQAVVGGLQ